MIHCTFENGNKASLRHVVVDAIVVKDEKILLAKRVKQLLEGEKWGLIAGYVERDENLQQTVVREVFEETGYKIKDITLLTIRDNPDRPHEDRQNISFVYICTALEKEGQKDWENTEVKWFSFNDLPKEGEFAFDHYKNIELYLKYKNENLTLPILV